MPPGDSPRSPIERFAAGVLDLKGEADSVTLAALCRNLQGHDFLPDPQAHEAILALAGRPIGPGSLLTESFAQAEERRLHREVEQFAAYFFGLSVELRIDQYRLLGLACAHHPRLIERLRRLRPALRIDRSSRLDPSTVVKRLVDDILDLFPQRPETRASEARERSERFRSDPDLTEAQRARALKELIKRHSDIIALMPEYPAQLGKGKVRRRASPEAFRARVTAFLGISDQRSWIIVVILLGGVGRLFSTLHSPSNSTATLPTIPKIVLPSADQKRMASAIHQSIREEFKGRIQLELSRIGKPVYSSQLDRVAAALPVEAIPPVGDLEALVRDGHWTEPLRNRFVAALKMALKSNDLGLTDAEIDSLAQRSFREATPRRAP